MMKRIVKVILLIALIVFCSALGTKILKLEKERKGKVQIVFKSELGVKESWVKSGTVVTLEKLPDSDETYFYCGWFDEEKRYAYENFIATETVILEPDNYRIDQPQSIYSMHAILDNGQSDLKYTYSIYGSNNSVRLPITPVKEGHKFIGWFNTKTNEEVTSKTPIQNMSIKARWEKIN